MGARMGKVFKTFLALVIAVVGFLVGVSVVGGGVKVRGGAQGGVVEACVRVRVSVCLGGSTGNCRSTNGCWSILPCRCV